MNIPFDFHRIAAQADAKMTTVWRTGREKVNTGIHEGLFRLTAKRHIQEDSDSRSESKALDNQRTTV